MYVKLPKSRIIPDPNQFYTECNRLGEKVIIVKGVCLYPRKTYLCEGCKYSEEVTKQKMLKSEKISDK